MKKFRLTAIFILSAGMFLLTSCGVKSYSAEEFFIPAVSGFNGSGKFSMSMNDDLYDRIIEECMPKDATDMEELQYEVILYDVSYDAEPKDNLSNGDKVNIKVKCDEKALESLNIRFTDTEFTYTVSGLEDAVLLDLTKDISVTFEGMSPDGTAVIEYVGGNEFVKNHVSYSSDGQVRNGGTITVSASYPAYAVENQGFIIDENTVSKEFTVSGLDEYLAGEADLSEIGSYMDSYINEKIENSGKYKSGAKISKSDFLKGYGNLTVDYKNYSINKYSITPVAEVFLYSEDGGIYSEGLFSSIKSHNKYIRFYKVNVEAEKKTDYGDDDGHQIGDVVSGDDIYYAVYLNDIVMTGNGELSYNTEDIVYTDLKRTLIGAQFADVFNSFTENSTFEIVFENDL